MLPGQKSPWAFFPRFQNCIEFFDNPTGDIRDIGAAGDVVAGVVCKVAGIFHGGLQVDIPVGFQRLFQPGVNRQVGAQPPKAVVQKGELLGCQQVICRAPIGRSAPGREVLQHQPFSLGMGGNHIGKFDRQVLLERLVDRNLSQPGACRPGTGTAVRFLQHQVEGLLSLAALRLHFDAAQSADRRQPLGDFTVSIAQHFQGVIASKAAQTCAELAVHKRPGAPARKVGLQAVR